MDRIIIASLIAIPLLSSCNMLKPIRSDIAEFIASFSLENSVATYKEAGYSSLKIENENEVEKSRETITVDFNIKDDSNISYFYEKNVIENAQIKAHELEKIETIDGVYYHYLNDTVEEIDTQKCVDIIKTFFYQSESSDGSYHSHGMYYGDLIIEMAKDAQDFMTINEEKTLLTLAYNREVTVEGKKANLQQSYSVNTLGMLTVNDMLYSFGDSSISQKIEVYCK